MSRKNTSLDQFVKTFKQPYLTWKLLSYNLVWPPPSQKNVTLHDLYTPANTSNNGFFCFDHMEKEKAVDFGKKMEKKNRRYKCRERESD